MALPSVRDNGLLGSTVVLGGDTWPGLAVVECDVSRAVDSQKRKGDDGANLVDQGYEPAKVKIVITGWLDEQQSELERLLPRIHPRRKGGIRTPLDIWHPTTQLVGVRQIYVTRVGPWTFGTGAQFGSWTMSIEAVEWFPAPKPAKAKTKKAAVDGDIPSRNEVLPPSANNSAETNF